MQARLKQELAGGSGGAGPALSALDRLSSIQEQDEVHIESCQQACSAACNSDCLAYVHECHWFTSCMQLSQPQSGIRRSVHAEEFQPQPSYMSM